MTGLCGIVRGIDILSEKKDVAVMSSTVFFKMGYRLKRLGIKGCALKVMKKMNLAHFNENEYLYQNYYTKLKEDDYAKELSDWYRMRTGRDPKYIEAPVTFNDKIQWMKLHDNTPIKAICADKYRVRDYIEQCGLGDKLHLIPLLGAWSDADDVDFDSLPNRFVLKQNAGSQMTCVVLDKRRIDKEKTRQMLRGWLNFTYGYMGMERQYLSCPKLIIAEEYIEEMDGNLHDYKVHCFNGEPKVIEVVGDRVIETHEAYTAFYDCDWKRLNIRTKYRTFIDYSEGQLRRPDNLDDILAVARKLSEPFMYVRVDLYNITSEEGNKIYFGELTFTPANGADEWEPESVDYEWGRMIKLPIEQN